MSNAPQATEPGATPGPQDQGQDKHNRLLGLVRKLVTYGRELVASLQRQNTPTPSMEVAQSFGTFNLAVIIARITRGLAIAAGLESRLLRARPTQAAPPPSPIHPPTPPRPRPARPPTERTARPPEPSRSEDDAALLRNLPSAQEIAARIRRRPAGAVIVEICRDLGIDASHPLWREIRDAIIFHDGSLAQMMKVWIARGTRFLEALSGDRTAAPADHGPLAASTGPP